MLIPPILVLALSAENSYSQKEFREKFCKDCECAHNAAGIEQPL